MKILYFITLPEKAGAQVHVADLIEGFYAKNEILLATSEHGWLTHESKKYSVKTHIISALRRDINPILDVISLLQLVRLLRSEKPDLIHLHSTKAGVIGRLAARICGVPSILTVHGWSFSEGIPRSRRVLGLVTEMIASFIPSKIITVSEYDKQLSKKYRIRGSASAVTIYNGVKYQDKFASLSSEKVRAVMVARLSEQKDHVSLLKALNISKNIHVDFIGGGPLEEKLIEFSNDLKVKDRVNFLGAHDSIISKLIDYDIFILTSNYEGFPISIIEAMMSGLPTIASNVGGISEAIDNNENGYLVERGDFKSIAKSIDALSQDRDLRIKMGAAARRKAIEKFNIRDMLQKTEMVYKDALNSRL